MKFRCKDIGIHFVCLTSLVIGFISWYSTRVLHLSPSARVLEHVKDSETLLILPLLAYGCGAGAMSSVLAWMMT